VRRPPAPEAETVFSLDEATAWIRARRNAP
jgi:hypothetical protein